MTKPLPVQALIKAAPVGDARQSVGKRNLPQVFIGLKQRSRPQVQRLALPPDQTGLLGLLLVEMSEAIPAPPLKAVSHGHHTANGQRTPDTEKLFLRLKQAAFSAAHQIEAV